MPRPPRNFHKSSLASLYQTSISQHQQQQQQRPGYNQQGGSSGMLRDIDLACGLLNPHDVTLPNIQAPQSLPQQPSGANNANPTNQEELVKAIQAIYGKTSTDILQKALGDWPQQSVSPPDCVFPNARQGGSSAIGNFNNNVSTSNAANSYPGQSRQDIQFSSNSNNHHQQQQHHSNHANQTPTNINNYRMSTSSLNSPHQQQQQHSSHRKSVLSLHHQQQQQHHQNDLTSNRKLKQHHHHMNTTNASFANHNTAASAACIATSTSAQLSDTINSSTLGGSGVACSSAASVGGGGSCGGNGTMAGPAATAASVPNILDPLGSMDNMFYDNSMQMDSDISPSNQHQQRSIRKHQQLQKLLKASSSSSQQITNTSPSPSATLPQAHRNETQFQRNITSANNMSQTQNIPMSSTSVSTISPPQPSGYSSVPKSLLNLAACTSNATASGNSSVQPAKFSGMVNQFRPARSSSNNNHQSNLNSNIDSACTSINRTPVRDSIINIDAVDISSEALEGVEHSSNLSQHIRSSAAITSNNTVSTSRPNAKQQHWSTILSEDQTLGSSNRTNAKLSTVNTSPSYKTQASKPASSTEAFLAKLQERAAKAGVSIGEISRSNHPSASLLSVPDTACYSPPPSQTSALDRPVSLTALTSPTYKNNELQDHWDLCDKKALTAALRAGTKNDLSLLYPPMQLASNSQKQINALSAGFQPRSDEQTELFTKEVKRIIHEECNIIYECKECRNLFRSLANLVKHKRYFCTEVKHRGSAGVGKRSNTNTIISPTDQESSANALEPDCSDSKLINHEQISLAELIRINEGVNLTAKKSDKGQAVIAMRAATHDHENKVQTKPRPSQSQSSLSKILQSQPKGRLPVSRDNALLGALSITSSANLIALNNALDDDIRSINSDQVDEHLVRNSSLAQTLLNEKLSRGESLEPRATRRIAPKRKLLEDCIQKVKRDKLLNEDEESVQQQQQPPNQSPEGEIKHEQPKNEQTTEIYPDDSESDPDMLTIDLDCDTRNKQKKKKRESNAGNCSSNSSTSSSVVKLNTSSSALLKALTRPVDSKRPYAAGATQNTSSDPKPNSDPQTSETGNNKHDSVLEGYDTVDLGLVIDAASPLFEKYTCDVCESDYDDLKALIDHTMENHVDMKMVYPCIFCSLSFIALENVCRHILDFHKKAKTQVHRLKDVVRSRSHLTADFLACSDYPPNAPNDLESQTDKTAPLSESSSYVQEQQQAHVEADVRLKTEGMVTRGKKRVDYNSMLNSRETVESSNYTTRARKTRSQSADQTNSEEPQVETHGKAASMDGTSMIIVEKKSDIDEETSNKQAEIDVCAATPKDQGDEDHDDTRYDNDDSDDDVDCDQLQVDDRSSDMEQTMGEDDNNDEDDVVGGDDLHDEEDVEDRKLPPENSRTNRDSFLDEQSDHDLQSDESDSDENELDIDDDDIPENHERHVAPDMDDDVDISDYEDDDDQGESGDEQGPDFSNRPLNDQGNLSESSHDLALSDNDSGDQNSDDQMEEGDEGDDLPQLETADRSNVSPENAKQVSSSTSLNKSSASELTPSSSGGSASGGIMKLKIQLKTRPDEKSKVYEIV